MPDQIYSVKLNGQVIRNYTFDGLGRLQKKSTPLSSGYEVEHIYSYRDLSGNRTSTQVSSFANRLGTYSYSYDYNGNITAIAFASWNEAVAPSKTTYYGYDALGQLVEATYDGVTHTYTYDGSGNILTKDGVALYTYGDNEWRDQLTSFNGQDFGYDALGNPTLYKGATLTWSEGRRLASYNNGAYSLTFAYDSSGKRIQKTVNGMEYNYVYSGDTVIAITNVNGTNVLKFICDENGDYIGFTYGTGTYYYVRNLQNDVVAIVDANQNVLATYSYDPWGNCTVSGALASTIGDINPIRYRGYFYDEETGLYYLQSRYYDPDTCRFINADEASVVTVSPDSANYDKNLYAYCDNNPVVRADECGYIWTTIGIMAVGGIIGGTISAITSFAMQSKFEDSVDWKSVGVAFASGFLSGALTASPFGKKTQVIGSVAIDTIAYVVECAVTDETFNVGVFAVNTALSVGSALIGVDDGPNMNKTLCNVIDNTRQTVTRESRRANTKYAAKSIASAIGYRNNTLAYTAWSEGAKFAANNVIVSYISNKLKKLFD